MATITIQSATVAPDIGNAANTERDVIGRVSWSAITACVAVALVASFGFFVMCVAAVAGGGRWTSNVLMYGLSCSASTAGSFTLCHDPAIHAPWLKPGSPGHVVAFTLVGLATGLAQQMGDLLADESPLASTMCYFVQVCRGESELGGRGRGGVAAGVSRRGRCTPITAMIPPSDPTGTKIPGTTPPGDLQKI